RTRADTPTRTVVGLAIAALVLSVLFPAFGVSLLLVVAVERVLELRRRADRNGAAEAFGEHLIDEDGDVALGTEGGG
ncbi:hypothetical protein H7H37_19565, partial [Mycolicibacterium insubricum]|nr:hypothetical protein [Mycolicibacterium insubricum]